MFVWTAVRVKSAATQCFNLRARTGRDLALDSLTTRSLRKYRKNLSELDLFDDPAPKSKMMDEITEKKIRDALVKSWSPETSVCYSEDAAPSYGQCAQTAIVIHERFGGEILKTDGWGLRPHYYNMIDGKRYDFTAGQFSEMPEYKCDIEYKNLRSDAKEALTDTTPSQVEALRCAFEKHLSK